MTEDVLLQGGSKHGETIAGPLEQTIILDGEIYVLDEKIKSTIVYRYNGTVDAK